jgi:hypothetical protein
VPSGGVLPCQHHVHVFTSCIRPGLEAAANDHFLSEGETLVALLLQPTNSGVKNHVTASRPEKSHVSGSPP